MKYVKKPIVIDAFQWGYDKTPRWAVFNKIVAQEGSYSYLRVNGGEHWVEWGDMVIRNKEGQHYSIKKDAFDSLFDPYKGK